MTHAEEILCFHYEIGRAITEWARVESQLRFAVISFIAPGDRKALSVGFFSIENFRSKLEFADKVVQRFHPGSPHHESWKKLVDRTRTASSQRNKLAHRKVNVFPDNTVGRRYALSPWIFKKEDKAKTKGLKPLPGALCLRDIVAIREEFHALSVALENFWHRAHMRPEPHPKSAEQAGRPPTVQQIKRQILGALEVQPKPSRKKRAPEAATS